MPELDKTRTFLDPITLEDIDIHDDSAVFYLLVLPNHAGFKIGGSTQNLNSPESRFDPETRIKECWLVNREVLNHADMAILFPDDKLRSEPFKTLEALNAAFRFPPPFDPTQPHETIKKHTFGPGVANRAILERELGARPTPTLFGFDRLANRMFDPQIGTYTTSHRSARTRQQPRRQQASTQEGELNYWQRTALSELTAHGLTEAMLLTHQDNGHVFELDHAYALINLVTARDFTVPDALAEIEGLTRRQAQQIREGLTRDEVMNPDAPRPGF